MEVVSLIFVLVVIVGIISIDHRLKKILQFLQQDRERKEQMRRTRQGD